MLRTRNVAGFGRVAQVTPDNGVLPIAQCRFSTPLLSPVILRSRALARRLEGWPQALAAHPSRLAVKNGEHLRMTAALFARQ
jgi:hypothetical protein